MASSLRELFVSVAGDDDVMSEPGVAGVVVLLNSESFVISKDAVKEEYKQRGWTDNHSLSFEDFESLSLALGWVCQLNEGDDGEEEAVEEAIKRSLYDQ